MIWVSESDRSAILQKIKDNQWASDYYNAFTQRVQPDLISYYKDPASYLRQLPFEFSLQKTNQIPPFKIINNADEDASVKRNMLQHFLKTGIDCGVLYYLTKDEKYAQYAKSLGKASIKMKLFITVGKGRDYTSVLAPPSSELGKFYSNKFTPTLVIRQKWEAWDQPFAVVFESFAGDKMEGIVKTVENIFQNGVFKVLIVKSIVDEKPIKQIVISQDSDEAIFEDQSLSIKFKGRYAIITLDNHSAFTDIYWQRIKFVFPRMVI